MMDIDIEAMECILDGIGIEISKEQVSYIVKRFIDHLDLMNMSYSATIESPKQECSKCKSLQSDLKEAERQIEVFKDSVKARRGATDVIVRDNNVLYR